MGIFVPRIEQSAQPITIANLIVISKVHDQDRKRAIPIFEDITNNISLNG